ncbi:MAG: zinc ribbon domain-containing protein [bacterium]
MPIYEYRCKNCGNEFELLRSVSQSDHEVECETCGQRQAEKQFSTFAASAGAAKSFNAASSSDTCCRASSGFS